MIDLDQIDFVCVFGLSNDIYEEIRPWLDKSSQRRLVFVTENPNAVETLRKKSDSILLFQDTRVKIYQIESPIQIELLAKKIAWQAVFLSI